MLLPQSQAYKTLSDRLATVSTLHLHLGNMQMKKESDASQAVGENFSKFLNFDELLARFESVQEKHSAFRMSLIQQKSLISLAKQGGNP